MRKHSAIVAAVLVIVMLLSACSPSSREATADDLLLVTRITALIPQASAAGKLANESETKMVLTSDYTAPNGDVLTKAVQESSMADPGQNDSYTIEMELAATIDGKNHTLHISASYEGYMQAHQTVMLDGVTLTGISL